MQKSVEPTLPEFLVENFNREHKVGETVIIKGSGKKGAWYAEAQITHAAIIRKEKAMVGLFQEHAYYSLHDLTILYTLQHPSERDADNEIPLIPPNDFPSETWPILYDVPFPVTATQFYHITEKYEGHVAYQRKEGKYVIKVWSPAAIPYITDYIKANP